MDVIYLDNNATTQPAPQVVAAMQEVNTRLWANPSSVHRFGQQVRQRVELARAAVAKLIGAKDRELIFTSGGTEANNLALRGVLAEGMKERRDEGTKDGCEAASGKRVLITTKIEHSAVREPAKLLGEWGGQVVYLPVDQSGFVEPVALRDALEINVRAADTAVVSVQWANNETGVLQAIGDLAAVIEGHRVKLRECEAASGRGRLLFHVDATQAVGKMAVNVHGAGIDLMTFAAHKFHGPKGVGALYVRSGVRLKPQNLGGPQERDRRGGTENTPGIIGMGVAAELAQAFVQDGAAIARLSALRDRFEQTLTHALPDAVINSVSRPRLWNTSNLGFPRLEAEAILLGLSERGVCASAGAACSSGSLEPSPVLLAMGIPESIAHGAVRFSLCRFTTEEEIGEASRVVIEVVKKLSRTLPVASAG
ncbi:MAG: cysteine desulfurase family protein [Phycisphaeraceae bacterium]